MGASHLEELHARGVDKRQNENINGVHHIWEDKGEEDANRFEMYVVKTYTHLKESRESVRGKRRKRGKQT